MASTTPLPCPPLPPVLNAVLTKNGVQYYYQCGAGFQMTGSPARYCNTATHQWSGTAPACTPINQKPQIYTSVFSQGGAAWWLAILFGVFFGLLFLTCLSLLFATCCCGYPLPFWISPWQRGSRGGCRCCRRRSSRGHRRLSVDSEASEDFYNQTKVTDIHNGPYIIPVNRSTKTQHIQTRVYDDYISEGPPVTTKKHHTQRHFPRESHRTVTDNIYYVRSPSGALYPVDKSQKMPSNVPHENVTELHYVRLPNGELQPLDKNAANLQHISFPQQTVYHVKSESGPGNNKKNPQNGQPTPKTTSSPQPKVVEREIVYIIQNGADDNKPNVTKNQGKGNKKKKQDQPHKPPTLTNKPVSQDDGDLKDQNKNPGQNKKTENTKSPKSDQTATNHDDESDKYLERSKDDSDSVKEPIRATYIKSGSYVKTNIYDTNDDLDLTPVDTPQPTHRQRDFKRVVNSIIDENRFRSAKQLGGWMPHSKPVRDNNTSTK